MTKNKKVLVGLSGGIDSTITAYLLKKEGFEVIGAHFEFYETASNNSHSEFKKLTKKLNIKLIHHDAKELFHNEIIDFYTSQHLNGYTPSPCAHCNPKVKWKLLIDLADQHNCDYVATGHYIQILNKQSPSRIIKAVDEKKDQSYYLWNMPDSILKRALTPLGQHLKTDIFNLAKDIGFSHLVKKSESAGLCFAQGKNCAEILNEYIPDIIDKIGPGAVLDRENKKIGTHKGYIYYTIGQKKGLNLDVKEKLSVSKIDASNNILWADTYQNLYKTEFEIRTPNFITTKDITKIEGVNTLVRGLGLNPYGFSKLTRLSENKYKVKLENPAWALAPGQPAVFYQGKELLGGGIIDA